MPATARVRRLSDRRPVASADANVKSLMDIGDWRISHLLLRSMAMRLELPEQSAGDAPEIGGQAWNPIGSAILSGKGEVGVLKVAAHAVCDVARERSVQSTADEG